VTPTTAATSHDARHGTSDDTSDGTGHETSGDPISMPGSAVAWVLSAVAGRFRDPDVHPGPDRAGSISDADGLFDDTEGEELP
jgi:hypothetical protein